MTGGMLMLGCRVVELQMRRMRKNMKMEMLEAYVNGTGGVRRAKAVTSSY
jgi:hypothetical protein